MADILLSRNLGAAGRPTLSSLIENLGNIRTQRRFELLIMATPSRPSVQVNGLPSVSEESPLVTPASERDKLKLNMLRRIRPPPFKYAWTFYHDRHSTSADYEGRLTTMLENIMTIKPFWEVFNQFPLAALKMKDSVHFFKRGVKPVWEDPRNINGGSWTFRVPKAQSEEFWKETLLLAVGEQFADVIQAHDDLCGVSLSVRFNSNLITLWNRDGTNRASIDGIMDVMLSKISPHLRPKEGSWYYRKHSEHAGFNDVVANAREKTISKEDKANIAEAEVREDEGNLALLKEAEGVTIEDLEEKQ